MKFRLIVPFGFLVLLSVGLLMWFGVRLAHDEQRRVQEELRDLYRGRLIDVESRLQDALSGIIVDVKRVTEQSGEDRGAWARAVVRRSRFVRQLFVQDSERRLIFPQLGSELSDRERDALLRTRSVWSSGIEFGRAEESQSVGLERSGWYTWFWDTGLQFLYWQIRPDGTVICAELDRVAVMAELIARLPETDLLSGETGGELIALLDERQRELYHWGSLQDSATAPYVTHSLAEPLTSWTLTLSRSRNEFDGGIGSSVRFNYLSGFILLGVVVLLLAVYVYRESLREFKEASTRLTFVNQVSHELKTPLTNIRLYSEVLEGQLDDENQQAQQSLSVIQNECRRLSRLIINVLTFSNRGQRKTKLHRVETDVNQVIDTVVESFRPSLNANGIEIQVSKGDVAECQIDRDILEQILGNLIANVEKYAKAGKLLDLTSRLEGDDLVVEVADGGPGIPREKAGFVFKPFCRLSNRVSDGVAGTGIGLTIARDLARTHGGELSLLDSKIGARFEVRLRTREENRI